MNTSNAPSDKKSISLALTNVISLHYVVFLLATLLPVVSKAQEPNFKFGSVRLLKSTAEYVELGIETKYDGLMGPLNLAVSAKSKDGTTRSYGMLPVLLPSGESDSVNVRVFSPSGLQAHKTDTLVAKVYQSGKQVVSRKYIDFPYGWPEVSAAQYNENEGRHIESAGEELVRNMAETLYEEDFESIEKLAENWMGKNDRDADGNQKIGAFSKAIRTLLSDGNWKINRRLFEKWQREYPLSSVAKIAFAIYWIEYAKDAGRYQQAYDEGGIGQKLFIERIRKAEALLTSSKLLADIFPAWQEVRLEIAMLEQRNPDEMDAIFRSVVEVFPESPQFYVFMVSYWLSHSNDPHRNDRARDALSSAFSTKSDASKNYEYATLFNQIGNWKYLQSDLLNDGIVSWSKIKLSFNSLLEKFSTPVNINYFAAAACRANDRETYLFARPRINNLLIPSVWPTGLSPDLCDRRFLYHI